MNFKKISIIAICILIVVSLVMPITVNAAQMTASTYWEQQASRGTSTYATTNLNKTITQVDATYGDMEFQYNTTDGHLYASLFYIGKTPTTANGGYYYLIIWHTQTLSLFSTTGKVNCTNNFNYKKCVSLEEAHEILFDTSLTEITVDGTTTSTYVFQPVILEVNSYTGTGYNGSEGDPSITTMGMGEYYTGKIYVPETPPEEEEEDESGIIGTLQKILNALNPFNWLKAVNGTLFLDKAGELINENLANNKFYTSLITVRNSLTNIYNEDYSDPEGFYNLGLTNFGLGKQTKYWVYKGGSHTLTRESYITIGGKEVRMDDVKVLNLDWYFGKDLGNNYYERGMKPYIDGIMSAFIWLLFAWALYVNMPNWISGEMTQIANLGTSAYKVNERKINTKLPTLEEKKKGGKKS